jgi:hypothetical protein
MNCGAGRIGADSAETGAGLRMIKFDLENLDCAVAEMQRRVS